MAAARLGAALYPHARTVALPTYPFQHRRYWLNRTPGADVSAAGLDRPEHPLLGAVTDLADRDEVVVSGRLSMSTCGWLTGHQVHNSVVFPATGFIEMVLRAGELADCPVIDELVLHTPLVLFENTPTDVQIVVQPTNDDGRRPFSVHARTGEQQRPTAWMLHASGVLSAEQPVVSAPLSAPPGIDPIDGDSFYGRLAAHGYHYSGPFRSLRAIGHHRDRPDVVYAQVELPADTDTSGYGVHPALLDAALHPLAAALDITTVDSDPEAPRLPFVFTGITLYATAATRLQVELTPHRGGHLQAARRRSDRRAGDHHPNSYPA